MSPCASVASPPERPYRCWLADGQATAAANNRVAAARLERVRCRRVRDRHRVVVRVRRVFRNERGQPLTKEERRLVLRYAFVIAIPLATIAAAGLLIGLFYVRHQLNDQIRTNKTAIMRVDALTRELNDERASRERDIGRAVRSIAQASFKECVENEAQDAANAALFRKVRTLILQGPQTNASQSLLDSITDTINAREPPGEKPCVLPG